MNPFTPALSGVSETMSSTGLTHTGVPGFMPTSSASTVATAADLRLRGHMPLASGMHLPRERGAAAPPSPAMWNSPCPAAQNLRSRVMPPEAAPPVPGSGGLDICFVMDCTSSMSPWIQAAKTIVKDMIAALPAEEPHKRVAFVAYRDFADGPAEVHAFTEDADAVVRFIDSQCAEGGMDIPEDVAGGLSAALALKWRAETRTVGLVTDAPCHGKKYHDDDDEYPDGDPTGLSIVKLLRAFRLSHIDFTFVQLQSGTHKMQKMLKAIYESAAGPENIRKYELRDLRDIIEEAGGAAAVSSMEPGVTAAVSIMLSAAVTPTIHASMGTSRAGVSMSSMPVRAAMTSMLASAPPIHGGARTLGAWA